MSNKEPWILKKTVLPQNTDHAGVMWHGNYFSWLEEARIKALSDVGIKYSDLVHEGYEMPVIEMSIRYLNPIFLGQEILIQTFFSLSRSPRIHILSNLINTNKMLVTEANFTLVIIKKNNFSIVRNKPDFLNDGLIKLNKGPSSINNKFI